METPPASPPSSGSSPYGESGQPPERPTAAATPEESPRGYERVREREPESLDAAPSASTEAEHATHTARDESAEQPAKPAPAKPELRPYAPQPPPPLRYGEPRPAITPNRIGEPIRTGESVSPRQINDAGATAPLVQQANQQVSENPPPAGSSPVGTPLSQPQPQPQVSPQPPSLQTQVQPPVLPAPQPQPQPQPQSYPAPQPQHQPQAQPQSSPPQRGATTPSYYPYPPQLPPQPTDPAAPSSAQPRPYGSPPTYVSPPPANTVPPVSAYSSGYAPAVPIARSATGSNGLLAVIAVLLAIIAIFQIINTFRPTRFDGAQPVQVQTKPLSQGTRDQVKDTLDKAQKAITDVNTQATQDYNAATSDTQRQAILAKYSFTLQQIVAQQQNDVLRIMQEQNTP